MDVIADDPLTIYDGAHNPAGASAVAEALPELVGQRRPVVGVLSVLEDKDASGMLEALLPSLDQVVFTRCANPRALSPATLETLAEKLDGPAAQTVPKPRAAMDRARELAGRAGAILATGSIYLVADLLREATDARASTL
jgi:dihydrofolate synthase / folylpolyglutamate synthase